MIQFPEKPRFGTEHSAVWGSLQRPLIVRYRRVALVNRNEHWTEPVEQVRKALLHRGYEVLCYDALKMGAQPPQCDLCLCFGGDGTVLKAARWLRETPICGVNLMPELSVGFLCSVLIDECSSLLQDLDNNLLNMRALQRMQCIVDGAPQATPILNDCLFASYTPARAAKYTLSYDNEQEVQCSSGVWVCTATGSSGATLSAGGQHMHPLDSRLQFRVREPNAMRQHTLLGAIIAQNQDFSLEPQKDDCKLFVDGGICEIALKAKCRAAFGLHPWPLWQLVPR